MTVHTAFPVRDIDRIARRAIGLASALLLVCGWNAAALGATGPASDCQELSKSLKSLETPVIELSFTLVDLPETDVELGLVTPSEPIRAVDSTADSTAPYLFLTPRVASMLREVFDDASDKEVSELVLTTPSSVGSRKESVLPPVAEGTSGQSPLTTLEEIELSTPVQAIPRFQRPMYRTDI